MATFQSGNKAAKKRRVGPAIVKLKGKKGLYLRWYETREQIQNYTITVPSSHDLSEPPAAKGGISATKNPSKRSPFGNILEKDDTILKIAGKPVNSRVDHVLKEFSGKQVLLRVNKGGKTGTTVPVIPRPG